MLSYHERPLIPWRIFDAKDGAVFMVCVEQDQWERLVELMGHPDWADLPIFETMEGRSENQDLVHTFVQEFVADWETMEFFHAAQARRICCAPVMSLAQLSSDPHIAERGFLRPVESGGPRFLASAVVGEAGRAPIRRTAPGLARHSAELRDESPTHDSSRDSSKPPGQAANSQATMPCPNVLATICLTGFSRQSAVCTPGPVASARTRSDRTSRTPNLSLIHISEPTRPY